MGHSQPRIAPGDFGASRVSKGLETTIGVPRSPQQQPEGTPHEFQTRLAGKFCKSREKRCFGGRFAQYQVEQMHIHAARGAIFFVRLRFSDFRICATSLAGLM